MFRLRPVRPISPSNCSSLMTTPPTMSISSPLSTRSYSSPSLSRTQSQSKLSPAPSTPTQRNLSSFAPWDRDQLVSRLSTFKNVLWSQLPDELGELEWARRGWVERRGGISGVTCDLCKATVEVIWDWERLRGNILSERAAKEEERKRGKEKEKEKEKEQEQEQEQVN